MVSHHEHDPDYLHYWSEHPRDRIFKTFQDALRPNSRASRHAIPSMTTISAMLFPAGPSVVR
eukprot:1154900-Pelagomonas_calceolata.AAC.3